MVRLLLASSRRLPVRPDWMGTGRLAEVLLQSGYSLRRPEKSSGLV